LRPIGFDGWLKYCEMQELFHRLALFKSNKEGMHLYDQMLEAVTMPNQFTFTSVLSACTSLPFLELGKRVHGHIVKLGFGLYFVVGNALVSLYAKCGSIEEACCMFDTMPLRKVYS
jgi:pentatricopeptide repeat protein